MSSDREYISVKEAADILGIKRQDIYAMLGRTGKIRSRQSEPGASFELLREDVEALAKEKI